MGLKGAIAGVLGTLSSKADLDHATKFIDGKGKSIVTAVLTMQTSASTRTALHRHSKASRRGPTGFCEMPRTPRRGSRSTAVCRAAGRSESLKPKPRPETKVTPSHFPTTTKPTSTPHSYALYECILTTETGNDRFILF